jgi:hypothetical protein
MSGRWRTQVVLVLGSLACNAECPSPLLMHAPQSLAFMWAGSKSSSTLATLFITTLILQASF